MLKKLFLLFILLLFCSTAWCQQDFYLKKIDSLTQANTKTTVDTTRINNLNTISFYYAILGDAKNGNDYAQKAMAMANKIHWPSGVIKAYSSMASQPGADVEALLKKALKVSLESNDKLLTGAVYEKLGNVSGNYNKKIDYYKKALAFYQQAGADKQYGGMLSDIAWAYESMGMYFEAIDYRIRYVRFSEKNNDTSGMIDANRMLGLTYLGKGDKAKALQYYLTALKIAGEKSGSKGFMLDINKEIGQIYRDQKDYKKALEYFRSALKYATDPKFLQGRIAILIEISNLHFKVGDKQQAKHHLDEAKQLIDALPQISGDKIYPCCLVANAAYEAGNYKEAIHYYQIVLDVELEYEKAGQAILHAKQMGLSGLGASYLALAKQQGNNRQLLAKSISCLEAVLPTYSETNSLGELEKGSRQLAEAYELTGQYQKSLSFYKEYLAYKDSLTSIERENAFVKKEAAFEYSQKENTLKAKQKAELQQEQTQRNYAYGGIGVFVFISIGAGVAYSRKRKDNRIIASEKKRSDELLLNILPAEVAEELKTTGEAGAKYYDRVSILFTDFVGFTKLSEKFSPEELIGELNYCFKAFDEIITRHNIEKIKTIGDSYMAVSGLPAGNDDHAINAVNAALEMRNFIDNYKAERQAQGRVYFEMRTGINSGQVVAGIVGIKKFAYDVWGDAVNIASRMESNGVAGKVNISESTFELIKDNYETEYRGELEAKGKGEIKMYFVEPKSNGWT